MFKALWYTVQALFLLINFSLADKLPPSIHTGTSKRAFSSEETVIGAANADRVEELAMLGRGKITGIKWSPNGENLAVSTSVGVWLYDSKDLQANPVWMPSEYPVASLNFSPNSNLIIYGLSNRIIQTLDVETGEKRYVSHEEFIPTDIAFSPDGKKLVVISGGNIHLWDATTWEELVEINAFPQHDDGADKILFNPIGSTFATCGGLSDDVVIWDAQTRVPEMIFPGSCGEGLAQVQQNLFLNTIAFSPDGKTLATHHLAEVRLWDIVSGDQKATFTLSDNDRDSVIALTFSPDGGFLGASSRDSAKIIDLATNDQREILLPNNPRIDMLAFKPNGFTLAVVTTDGLIYLIDAAGNEEQHVQAGLAPIHKVVFSPMANIIATSSNFDDAIRLWDADTGRQTGILEDSISKGLFEGDDQGEVYYGYNYIRDIIFSPDGTLLASINDSGIINLWDMATNSQLGIPVKEGVGHGSFPVLTFSPDGNLLTFTRVNRGNDFIQLWDVQTRTETNALQAHHRLIIDANFSSSGTLLASGGSDEGYRGAVQLWDITRGVPLFRLGENEHGVRSITFSPDGSLLAFGSDFGLLELWDIETRQRIISSQLNFYPLAHLVFSPDSSLLATAADFSNQANDIYLLDGTTGEENHVLIGHDDAISDITFSGDNSLLASSSRDGSIRLWDTDTGQELRVLKHTDEVTSLAFSPDGTLLVSSSLDGTVRIWGIATSLGQTPQE